MSNDGQLTLLRRKWLQLYLDQSNKATFGNAAESVRQAGYNVTSDQSACNIGSENKKICARLIDEWLNEEGLSTNALKLKIIKGMEAKETKLAQHEGTFTDSRELAAHGIQYKYTELACKIQGMVADNKLELSGVEEIVNNMNEATKRLERMAGGRTESEGS